MVKNFIEKNKEDLIDIGKSIAAILIILITIKGFALAANFFFQKEQEAIKIKPSTMIECVTIDGEKIVAERVRYWDGFMTAEMEDGTVYMIKSYKENAER